MLLKFIINGIYVEFVEDDDMVIRKLLRDDNFTSEFFEKAIQENRLSNFGLDAERQENLEITRCVMENESASDVSDSSSSTIWSNRRPSELDNRATDYLLDLREKYSNLFDDRKSTKMSVWQRIAEQMQNNGFSVGNKKDGAEKCRQKFANLQKSYGIYIQHCNKTGAERKDPPPYYEKLHSILGSKHKFYPVRIEDTLNTAIQDSGSQSPVSANSEEIVESDLTEINVPNIDVVGTSGDVHSKFSKGIKRIRPSSHQEIINTLKEINNAAIATIVQSNSEIRDELKEQNALLKQQLDQRERLIDAFKDVVTAYKK